MGWKNLYDLSPGYSFTLAEDGMFLKMNHHFQQTLGLENGENIKIEEVLAVGSKIFYQTHFLPLIKLQQEATEIFLSFKSKSNETLPVLLNVLRIYQDGKYYLHSAGLQISQRNKFENDIIKAKDAAEKALLENTDMIRLKNDLESAHHTIEQQLQQITRITNQQQHINKVLSHDLQEPLRKISFFASMVEKNGEEVDTNIAKILQSSERMRNLLSRMQRLHALDNHRFKPQRINLSEVIEKVKKNMDARNLKLSITLKNDIALEADSNHLADIFEELFDNSIKFKQAEQAAAVTIATDFFVQNAFIETEHKYKYDKYLRIIYTDDGTGFDNAYANLVFDIFQKLHINDGLGIGLTYVKKIVDLHQGNISVNSKEGIGTTFTILLPFKK